MKKIIIIISVFFSIRTTAQEISKKYTQELKGSTLSFDMVSVPGGQFVMGNNSGPENEKPEHNVEVSPFWMSSHEVTWDLFELFISKDLEKNKNTSAQIPTDVDAVTRPTKPYLDMTFGMGKLGYPAIAMTHYNAIQFCKWLYTRTGVFYRLPTEAEWEFAAKTGLNEDYLNNKAAYAWSDLNSQNTTQKAGSKSPNKYGIFDLFGNASEWTYDQYDPDYYKNFEGKTTKNPVNVPEKLYAHSVRGGSYLDDPEKLTPTYRDYSDPSWKQIDPQIPKSDWWIPDAPFVGIRLVRPAITPTLEEINSYYDKAPIKDY